MERKIKSEGKQIPYPRILYVQFLVTILTGVVLLDLFIYRKDLILLISLLFAAFLTQFLMLPLSLLFWNKPLVFDFGGISKKGIVHRWDDIESIRHFSSTVLGIYIMTFVYKDGSKIRFEPFLLIETFIFRYCKNNEVIEKYKKTWNHREKWPDHS